MTCSSLDFVVLALAALICFDTVDETVIFFTRSIQPPYEEGGLFIRPDKKIMVLKENGSTETSIIVRNYL